MNDQRLLRDFIERGSQAAFSELSKRYMRLVYSTCYRELGSSDLAQDATQAVFLLMAHKARSLRGHSNLPGWLFNAARLVSKNIRKMELRRQKMEQALMEQTSTSVPQSEPEWNAIDPLLNDALTALKDRDRDAILLRYFEGRTLSEIGAIHGVTEEGASKQVGRALEKMRVYFQRHDVTVSIAALSLLFAAHAAKAVPVGCAAAVDTLSASAVAGSAALANASPQIAQITQGAIRSMNIATIKTFAAIGITSLTIGGVAQHVAVGAHSAAVSAAHGKISAAQKAALASGVEPQVLTLLNKVQNTYAQAKGLTEDCEYRTKNLSFGDKNASSANTPTVQQDNISFTATARMLRPGFVDITKNDLFARAIQADCVEHWVSDGPNLWQGMVITKNGAVLRAYRKMPFEAKRALVYSDWNSVEAGSFFNVYDWVKTIGDGKLQEWSYAGKETVDGVSYDVLSIQPAQTTVGTGPEAKIDVSSDKVYIGADNFIHMRVDNDTIKSFNSAKPEEGRQNITIHTLIYKNIRLDQTLDPSSFQFTPSPGSVDMSNKFGEEQPQNAGEG